MLLPAAIANSTATFGFCHKIFRDAFSSARWRSWPAGICSAIRKASAGSVSAAMPTSMENADFRTAPKDCLAASAAARSGSTPAHWMSVMNRASERASETGSARAQASAASGSFSLQ
jgi:hypothetical protein